MRTDAHVAAHDPDFYRARGFERVQVEGGEYRHVLWAWLDAPCPEMDTHIWPYGKISRCKIQSQKPKTCVEFPRLPQDVAGTPCSYWFTSDDGQAIGGTGSPHASTVEELRSIEGRHAPCA